MKNRIVFIVKEQCEVYGLKTMLEFLKCLGDNVLLYILLDQVNTDFNYNKQPIEAYFKGSNLIHFKEIIKQRSKFIVCGFHNTGKNGTLDYLKDISFDISLILSCQKPIIKTKKISKKCLVIGNIKIDNKSLDFQEPIFKKITSFNYKTIIVPRHPIECKSTLNYLSRFNFNIINKVGYLREAYGSSDLNVMGRVFSLNADTETEHNPFEATQNSYAISGIVKNPPHYYRWIFEHSSLIYQCSTLDHVLDLIEELIECPEINKKLEEKKLWILNQYRIVKNFSIEEFKKVGLNLNH